MTTINNVYTKKCNFFKRLKKKLFEIMRLWNRILYVTLSKIVLTKFIHIGLCKII